MRQRQGFSLIELLVSSAVTFLTVLTVSAAFLNYSQSFYTQAGIRGGQASLRQSHLMVIRNLRMAGYGIDPHLAFDFPDGWRRNDTNNRSNRLVFRMRNPAFNAMATKIDGSSITLSAPLRERLRQGQIIQAVCNGSASWSYAQLSADAMAGSSALQLAPATNKFPNKNGDFNTASCFKTAGINNKVYIFKIDVYDYSIRFIDGRPYLFRQHGLGPKSSIDPYGEPVAEDIEAFRVTFLREDGTPFIPNPAEPAPTYETAADHADRLNKNPANIRAVIVGMVARSSTRDLSTTADNSIPPFSKREESVAAFNPTAGDRAQELPLENKIELDRATNQKLSPGIRRVVSEMTVQVRNMRSSEMPLPLYSLATGSCEGSVPSDDYNCAGG
ncbi:PilW family protein [Cystobacter fuscus]|nr:PilW family protein [Cystobacter fuscus]